MFKPIKLETSLIREIGNALKPVLDNRINDIAETAYEGGYNDCLCDVDDFLRRVRVLPELVDRVWEVFADPTRRPVKRKEEPDFE